MSRKAGLHVENYRVREGVERTTSDGETGLNNQQEEADGLKIEGLALPFNKRSRNGVVYQKESIKKAAKTLEGCPILFNHNENEVLGHVQSVELTDEGLRYVGDLNEDRREVDSLKRGDIPHVSIQAIIEELDETQKTGKVAIKEFLEMSAVTIPGFPETDVQTEEQAVMIEKLMTEQEAKNKFIESLENPEFGEGDEVEWEFGSGTSQGRVTDVKNEVGDSMSAGGNEFTIEEGDGPLYKIQEWDESAGNSGEFTNDVVKFEDALSETSIDKSGENVSREQYVFEFEPRPDQVLYLDRDKALLRAQSLGLEGVHEHQCDGKNMWMAGQNHQEWKQAMRGELDNEESVSKEPFADYDDFEDCVSQNSDKADPEAYCAVVKRKTKTASKLKEAVSDVDTQPTAEMAEIAGEVLEKIDSSEFDNDDCGTRVGLERANQLENREELSPDTINRMVSFFARHDGNQTVDDDVDSKWEDCGFVAWQLWGGDPGREWAERKQSELENVKNEILDGDKTVTEKQEEQEQVSTEQLEEVAEDDFMGLVADMYPEVSVSDVSSLMSEFEFSSDPEPLVAAVADVADMTPADLMEMLDSEAEEMDDEEDEDDMEEEGDYSDDEEEESESSNKNESEENNSQQDNMTEKSEDKSREELVERIEKLESMIEEMEDVEESKQDSPVSSSEKSEISLNEKAQQLLSRR